jgi:CRISPR-associated endonuclease/helicase Cas3
MTCEFLAHHRESDGAEQCVREHLEEVSGAAEAFAGKIGLSSVGKLIGLLHDFGKYSAAFQGYIKSATGIINPDEDEFIDYKGIKGKVDHSTAGAQFIWDALKGKGPESELAAQIMALCMASHHSGLIDCISPDGTDRFHLRLGKAKDRTHLDEVKANADKTIRACADELLISPLIREELRKCLNSFFQGEQSVETREFMLGLMVRFLFSSLIDADRLSTANFENPVEACERYNGGYPEWKSLIQKLDRHITGFPNRNRIDEIRTNISSACLASASREKGLYQLTVPTGGGKTLSSLRFALHHAAHHRMDRIVYVIPFTSIIDQNAAVVHSILEDPAEGVENGGRQVVLEHHSNLTPGKDTWQSKILAENWDAPVVFTTAVQFLEALFAGGTRGARRMHQLANAVIIFDEIQTIPIKAVHLFNNAINFLVSRQCGSTVVFCTATQPILDKVDIEKGAARLSPNPEMMSDVGGFFRDLRRVEVMDKRKSGGWTEDEVADCALQEMKNSGSVLVIVNTKSAAQEVFKRCKNETKGVFHLSTNMCPAHRMDALMEIKRYLDPTVSVPFICVSTQLIEAGVDVDFGSVIRYLAGLDSVAQAAGRCNRNGLRPIGRVFVINPAREDLSKLPDIRVAREKAERVLDEYRNDPTAFDCDLVGPKVMAQYYQYYFFDRAHEMAYPVSHRVLGRNDSLLSLLSMNTLSVEEYKRTFRKAPPLSLRQSFKSAADLFSVIDAPTEGVIVPYREEGERIIADLCAASQIEKRYDLLKKAQGYSVNLFPYVFERLSDAGCIHEAQDGSGIFYLDQRYYSRDFGVSLEQLEQLKTLIE